MSVLRPDASCLLSLVVSLTASTFPNLHLTPAQRERHAPKATVTSGVPVSCTHLGAVDGMAL